MSDTEFERHQPAFSRPEQPMKNSQPNFGHMAIGAAVTLVVGLLFNTIVGGPIQRADSLQEQRIVTLEKFAEASRDDRAALHQQANTLSLQVNEVSRRREDDRNEYKQALAELKTELGEIRDLLEARRSDYPGPYRKAK